MQSAIESDDNKQRRLTALSLALRDLREESIKGRADSGIEQIWREDEEYYEGIDDANHDERQVKPRSSDGRVTTERKPKKSTRSNVFLNITSRYVNAAAAHVADKLLPSDESNFGLRATPIPDLIEKSKDASPAEDEQGFPITEPVTDENGEPQMQPHIVNGQPMIDDNTGQPVMNPAVKQLTNGDLAKKEIEAANVAAEKAKTQIDDWLRECGSNGQNRQVVNDAAKIGTGVLKGPFPELVRKRAVVKTPNGIKMIIKDEIVPKNRRVNAWNLYPDPSCGEDIHRGKYIWEEDEINSRLLSELKSDPSYLSGAIDRVLKEGPINTATGVSKRGKEQKKNEIFQLWYFHGYVSREDLEACGYAFKQDEDVGLMNAGEDEQEEPEDCAKNQNDHYPVIAVMVNDTIIKATLSPFDSGRFPYQVMRWQYKPGHWAGTGVSRQMRTSQDGVNAGTRMMHDNAGVSGAPILIFDRKKLVPADGNWTVGPHKVYYTSDDYDGGNIRDAITWIITPSMQNEMMNIIQFWMKAAEEETGLPMILQGNIPQGNQTRGGIQIQHNNGTSMLRRVTNIYDDDVTKHNIAGFYEWLLIHGEDDSMKGDFTIDARGSSVLIERDAQSQILMQMLGMSLNPAYGADPELVFKEFLLSQRFDAQKLELSEEKKAELAKRQPPPDPRIQVQEMKSADLKAETQAKLTLQDHHHQVDIALKQWEKNIDIQLANLQAGTNKEMSADEIKASLAEAAMKLRAQVGLAMNNYKSQQLTTPSFEPQGRAPDGQAFQA